MKILVLSLLVGFPAVCLSQTNDEYIKYTGMADSLYQAKDFVASASFYSRAFRSNGWKALIGDRYNAACSWAMAGNADSAFIHLEKISGQMTNLGHLTNDSDLVPLHTDKRWQLLVAKVKQNKEKAEINLNKPLARELDSIYTEDQQSRQKINELEKKYGYKSKEMQDMWKVIMKKDSTNLRRVTAILDHYGWLGRDVVGGQGNTTLFLVIQHADQKTQEKYLPMMREAVKNGKAQGADLALLEDRVALAQGRKQIYGSQIHQDPATGKYFVAPIEDEVNVNKRRAEVGLDPLEKYARHWGIEYKLPRK